MEQLLEILEAKYLYGYVIRLKFNTNEEFDLDLTPMIEQDKIGIYAPLKQVEFFRNFSVNYTLCWGDEIEVAPEYIYFFAHRNDIEYQSLFKEWGYVA